MWSNKSLIEKLYGLALLAFVPTLFFYYVGEEGSFTSSALEMWQSGNFLMPTLFGIDTGRPPLLYWPTVAVSSVLGWHNVLLGSRIVAVGATLLASAVLIRLVWRAYGDRQLAVFTGLIFLTTIDLSLYRGWLAYADPVFALFVFSAMASLWLATLEKRAGWLVLALVSVSCAFLSKALTAYVFYAITFVVLLRDRENRRFLLSPTSLLLHAAMLLVPWLWINFAPVGHGQGGSMLSEIQRKLGGLSLAEYLSKRLSFSLEIVAGFLPGSALVIWLWWKNRTQAGFGTDQHLRTAFWIVMLNLLPYWLSPQSGIRYLLPIYPFVAFVFAATIWRCGDQAIRLAKKWIIAALVLKIVFVLILFPYYQASYRGKNYRDTAAQIVQLTQGYPVYFEDTRAVALSIGSYINSMRYPQQPLIGRLPTRPENGFMMSFEPDLTWGKLVKEYPFGDEKLRLMCNGSACMERR